MVGVGVALGGETLVEDISLYIRSNKDPYSPVG